MRVCRARFKYALRYTKHIEDTARADALAKDFCDYDNDEFWKGVKKLNQSNNIQANCIEGKTGEKDIANHWKEYFCKLLNNNVINETLKDSIMGKLEGIQYTVTMSVSTEEVTETISKLKKGKSCGPDGICAEALKAAHHKVYVLLSLCFSLCMSHGYIPQPLIETTIVPIIKNKAGNLSSGNNYRPIALANVMSKVFESLILLRCEQFLTTADNQFGFKSGHSTDFCIYTLKEFIEYYKQRNTTIFVTFLDASKAFDRIDHWLLFKKLIDKHVLLFIIRLLVCWYSTQKMHIRWGNTVTSSFLVSNGVKQGGIISPILFNVYMDQLSEKLNASNIGGNIGGKLVNHLCYADDICLISLSFVGMQQLLSICDIYAKEHDLLYNGGKSYSLCFKPKCSTFNRPTFTLNHLNIPNVNQSKYLGIVINETNCKPDLKRQMCKLYANINMLIRKFTKCSPDVKCFLFKSYCSNLYCSILWYDCSKTALKNLRIAYNNSLRKLLGIPKYNSASEMFVCLNIPSFNELLRKHVYSYRSILLASHNCILLSMCSSVVPLYSPIWAWWECILTPL